MSNIRVGELLGDDTWSCSHPGRMDVETYARDFTLVGGNTEQEGYSNGPEWQSPFSCYFVFLNRNVIHATLCRSIKSTTQSQFPPPRSVSYCSTSSAVGRSIARYNSMRAEWLSPVASISLSVDNSASALRGLTSTRKRLDLLCINLGDLVVIEPPPLSILFFPLPALRIYGSLFLDV